MTCAITRAFLALLLLFPPAAASAELVGAVSDLTRIDGPGRLRDIEEEGFACVR